MPIGLPLGAESGYPGVGQSQKSDLCVRSLMSKGEAMAIGNAVQKGAVVHIYDEKGRILTTVSAGSGKDDGLKGYTSTTVNVRRGGVIYSYNEKGRVVNTTSAR